MMVLDAPPAPQSDPFEMALRDGAGCLDFLLSAPTREGATVGELARGRPITHLSWRALQTLGVAVQASPGSAFSAIATAHPFLARCFADGPWCGIWTDALLTLPGTLRGDRMRFGRSYASTILLPRALLTRPS